jgi:hypothetical protein
MNMKRLKLIFATLLLLLGLPFWRYLDLAIWLWGIPFIYSFLLFTCGLIFFVIPVWLLTSKRVALVGLALLLTITGINYQMGPLSSKATKYPNLNHCGLFTYTGTFYPLMNFFTPSHTDDLEVRNQLCWLKKMIGRLPQHFDQSGELDQFLKISQDKLLSPENKFRVTLPLIGLFHALIFTRYSDNSQISSATNGKLFLDSLRFWENQYTMEIHSKEYPWWDFPHGPYIKWEYGMIEKNWQKIIDSLTLENPV